MVFTTNDLERLLRPVPYARRKAIMFCLANNTQPQDIIALHWTSVFASRLTDLARNIVRSVPRHYKLPYVFWEYLDGGNGLAGPMFDLEQTLLEHTGMNFEQLQERFDGMMLIDESAEADAFMAALQTV